MRCEQVRLLVDGLKVEMRKKVGRWWWKSLRGTNPLLLFICRNAFSPCGIFLISFSLFLLLRKSRLERTFRNYYGRSRRTTKSSSSLTASAVQNLLICHLHILKGWSFKNFNWHPFHPSLTNFNCLSPCTLFISFTPSPLLLSSPLILPPLFVPYVF